jgi:TonB-linked SusC/RagA family outer membrane protein
MKEYISKISFIVIFSFIPLFLSAQSAGEITGQVVDQNGEPLIGVTVSIKGSTDGTITDLDGNFSIKANPQTVLKITYVGFVEQEITVGNQKRLNIEMHEDAQMLKDVVVVGYGTMDRRSVTSSISSIKGDNLTSGIGGSTVATALQGKIPGLTISGTSSPNASNGFQLRGVASVNAGKGPLVVIDGIPGGDLRSLNQEDIESIDVLKDASAGAIYGTRAAGGVILVTTKQAKSGAVKVSYTGEFSTEMVRKRPEMLSASEYVAAGLGEDYGYDTDWYKELLNEQPFSHRHVINISGGSDNALVYTTFTMQDQKGIVIGDGRKDYSGRINTKFKLFDGKVEIKTNTQYREATRDQRNSSGTFNMALGLNPTIPLYDEDEVSGYNIYGNGKGITGTNFNPVADIELRTNKGKDKWLLADATLKFNVTEDLSVQGTIGYQESQWQQYKYVSAFHRESLDATRRGEAYHGFSKDERFSAEAYATYNKTFAVDHHINAVVGYSFWEANGENFNMTNYDFPIEGVGPWDMSSGMYLSDGYAKMSSYKDPRERLLSFFGRANYTYKDRYMVTASMRREGSSKFGKNNRWGNFWAISGGWRLSDEAFMKNVKVVNDLKIRLGYGVTGNNSFGNDYTVRMYQSNQMWPTNGQWNPAYGAKRNVNYDLQWEEKKEINFGFDYSLFNNRLYGKFDAYKRKADKLLFEVDAPQPPMVHATIMKNIGSLENKGWEFEVGGDIVRKKDFTYSSTMRFSQNKSKILDMGDDASYIESDAFPSPGNPGKAVRIKKDSDVGQFFVFKYAGVNEDGKWLIYDKDNNPVLADDKSLVVDNKHYVGNAIPKLIIAWDHTFQYKEWDLGIYLRSWIDFDVFSQVNMYYGLKNQSQYNVLKDAYNRNNHINDEKILSDYWLDDGTFLKIDAITLGYTLNLKKFTKYAERARFYLTARDVAVFTGYKGINPEVNINGLFPGFEYIKSTDSMYPQTCRLTLGVNLTF